MVQNRILKMDSKTILITFLLCLKINFGFSNKFSSVSNSNSGDSASEHDNYLLQKEHILEKSYHGLIRENETFVEITPLIKVDEQKVCDFRILKKPHHEIPFRIELVNNLGILKARRTLNCEKRRGYHFEIIAILCDGSHSIPANVHISVIDINEYAPTFLQPSYVTEVDEGRLYQEILRVEATDKDCTPPYGDVCKYKILNDDEPFTIDNEGSIKNTEPLSHKISHNHILQVVAYDCAMKQSVPIMASIKVRRVCEARLAGIPERIDYTANSMESLSLFPNIRIELCDIHCNQENMNIHVSVSLKTKHISFGCDRDITQCSKNHQLIDVLPKGAEWTKDLIYDEGLESVFHFDGSSGAIVPDSLVTKHDFGSNPFSIVAMFKHTSSSQSNKHAKEHIICSADDHKMNRHHMALFVRNCRLILLIRKNYNEGDLNMFSPAEWRWKIPQVCDNEWHHYVLNIDLPKVELYIDGAKFENQAEDRHSNPEVIDDWPLHAAHGVNTTLTVGACYQGSENRLKHGFNGDISEIKLSLNKILTSDDVRCGTYCAEHLIPPSEKYLEFEQEVQSNSQFNEIYIEGSNKSNIEQLLGNIQYINTKQNPTIGRRNIEVRTTLTCPNQSAVRLPIVETYIMVNEQPQLQSSQQQQKQSSIGTIMDTSINSLLTSRSDLITTKSNGHYINDYNLLKDNKNLLSSHLSTQIDNNNQQQQHNNNNNNNNHQNNNKLSDISDLNYDHNDLILKSDKPKIIINGNPNHLVSYPDIKDGVRILASINITVYSGQEIQSNLQTLDSCSVSVFPSLNPDHEEIALDNDESLSTTLDIKTNINKDGVEMIGYDTTQNYLDVLKALIYTNKKPAYYLNRVFKLSCSQVNSRFKSAEFTLTLTVLHPKQSNIATTNNPIGGGGGNGGGNNNGINGSNNNGGGSNNNMNKNSNQNNIDNNNNNNNMDNELPQQHLLKQHESNVFAHAMVHSHDVQEPKSKIHSIIHRAQSSHPTMLIIVICVFFVILLCGVSIARIRNNNNKYMERRQPCPKIATEQLDWDDSALTITINPMQNDVVSDESSESENSDSDDDEVLNGKYKNVSQLEWDNSTM